MSLLSLGFTLVSPWQGLAQTPRVVNLPPAPPHSVAEPAAAKTTASLADSTAAAPKDLLTVFETSGFQATGNYQETLDFMRKLEKRSPFIKMNKIGTTPQGRDLMLTIVSKDRAFTPELAAKTGKTIVMIQSGIHAGEISGKDATNLLLRDILVTKKFAAWLDKVILLVVPVYNVDGHERTSPYNRINQNGPREMGFRVTAQRYNLNRDYVKADAPETRAWLSVWNAWLPDFHIDNHVTDGMDYQYDVTIGMATEQEIWPTVADWEKQTYLPAINREMEKLGHVVGFYADPINGNDIAAGFEGAPTIPRFSTGYAALHNRPSLLIESHSLKAYRTQVWSHYDLMRVTIDLLAANGQKLHALVKEADTAMAKLGEHYDPATKVFLNGEMSGESTPITFKGVNSRQETSVASGGKYPVYLPEPKDTPTKFFNKLKPTAEASVPLAYLIPAEWTDVIHLLELHGVKTERLPAPLTSECEVYRFNTVRWQERPYEGRHPMSFTFATMTEKRTFPAGTVRVPMNQRAARVALNILEPNATDSALRWGFFDTIFEQKEYFSDYIFAPIAAEMLALDPQLKAEFEEKLKNDPKFAANPNERLQFLYRRSPYFEADKDVYPVVRVVR
ncbi:MAG: M14 family metallopeptidase [Blastocatellia bacterium]|nr:M14 family metallopeptidase [Blastocatellia bacterium]